MLITKARLGALDGWRTVAILLVIVQHAMYALQSKIPEAFQIFREFGHLGVEFFFVISGYVICSALQKEYEHHGRISLTAFYIRRCFRILPPLLIYLAFIGVLSHIGLVGTSITQERNAATFLCNLPIADCRSWQIIHTWSLAYEEQFYIVFPITLLILSLRRRHFILGVFLMTPIVVVVSYYLKARFVAVYFITFQFLLTGVLVALYSEEIKPYLRKVKPTIIYLLIAAIFIIDHIAATPLITVLKMATGPMMGIVFFYTSHFPCVAKTCLSYPAIRYTGRISYSLYLWQQVATGSYEGAGALFYVCSLGLTAIISVVSFAWIEQPLIHFAARLSRAQIERGSVRP